MDWILISNYIAYIIPSMLIASVPGVIFGFLGGLMQAVKTGDDDKGGFRGIAIYLVIVMTVTPVCLLAYAPNAKISANKDLLKIRYTSIDFAEQVEGKAIKMLDNVEKLIEKKISEE